MLLAILFCILKNNASGYQATVTAVDIIDTLAVFDWAISWSTLTAWSTFRIRLVLHVIPWSTKDVRRNACDIFRS